MSTISSPNKMTHTPSTERVTVFIPTFNRLEFLRRAVASALQQGAAVRVHVLDNASIDGTAQWLTDTAATEPRLSFTARSVNVGALRNFEDGFNGVRTPYLIPLADDDELIPGFVPRALAIAEQDTTLAAVIGQSVVVENNRELYRFPTRTTWGRLPAASHLREWLTGGHYITWSAILWSTRAVQAARVIEDLGDFGLPSDVWFQGRIFAEHPVYLLETPGATFVRHSEQTSAGLRFSPEIMRDYSHLHQCIDDLLRERSLYAMHEHKRLMARFAKRTCECARDWLQRSPPHKSHMHDMCLSLTQYERGFAPFCGWRPCPVLPHRARSLGDLWFRARSMAAWLSQRPRYARLADEQERDALSTVLARAPQ
jgi:glycosyltransferase involved in cell wall biosynthesis